MIPPVPTAHCQVPGNRTLPPPQRSQSQGRGGDRETGWGSFVIGSCLCLDQVSVADEPHKSISSNDRSWGGGSRLLLSRMAGLSPVAGSAPPKSQEGEVFHVTSYLITVELGGGGQDFCIQSRCPPTKESHPMPTAVWNKWVLVDHQKTSKLHWGHAGQPSLRSQAGSSLDCPWLGGLQGGPGGSGGKGGLSGQTPVCRGPRLFGSPVLQEACGRNSSSAPSRPCQETGPSIHLAAGRWRLDIVATESPRHQEPGVWCRG